MNKNTTSMPLHIPNLRQDPDYQYIGKTILSVLQEQKVSFKQAKEILAIIESNLKEKSETEFDISGIKIDESTKPVMSDMDRLIYKLDQIKIRLEDLSPHNGRMYTKDLNV